MYRTDVKTSFPILCRGGQNKDKVDLSAFRYLQNESAEGQEEGCFMKRRILAVLMTAVLAAGALFGCGDSGKKGGTEDSQESEKNTTVTVTTWDELSDNEDLNMFIQCGKELGINVEIMFIPSSEYFSKLNQMVATGDASADIYIVWENNLKEFADAGGVIELDGYLADSQIDTGDFIEAFGELTDGMGATYGLPWCAATEVMYYNQDLFDAAGVAYPTNDWTYAQYVDAARRLTRRAEDGTTEIYGSELPTKETWWAGFGSAGDQVYNPETGQMEIGEGAVSLLRDFRTLVAEGVMPAPPSDSDRDLFRDGKAAMAWAGSWEIAAYGDELGFNWEIAPIPVNKRAYNTLHTGFYTINSKSKNKDAAWEVIEYLMSEKGQTLNSEESGNLSSLKSIAAKGAWKVDNAPTIENWDAMMIALETGAFGYTCLPSGVSANALNWFDAALTGEITAEDAVSQVSDYAAKVIGY